MQIALWWVMRIKAHHANDRKDIFLAEDYQGSNLLQKVWNWKVFFHLAGITHGAENDKNDGENITFKIYVS